MTDFNVNTSSKENLRQRINRAQQQLKSLKKKSAWSALLKPDRMRPPRRCHAGAMTLREATVWTLMRAWKCGGHYHFFVMKTTFIFLDLLTNGVNI